MKSVAPRKWRSVDRFVPDFEPPAPFKTRPENIRHRKLAPQPRHDPNLRLPASILLLVFLALGWIPTQRLGAQPPGVPGTERDAPPGEGRIESPGATRDEEVYLWYPERPLEPRDFRGKVPDERPLEEPRIEAYSHTELRYQFDARTRGRAGRYTSELTSITVHALLDRSQSWNAQPQSLELLDHHQGHFDLTEITAREAERQLRAMIRPPRRLTGRGRTEPEAIRDLERQIQEHLAGHVESLKRDIDYFDQITRYGTLPDMEARERHKQKQLLERSAESRRSSSSPP
jgi:hypothetical protein